MKIVLLPEAESEMFEAARYYEQRQPDLGMRFLRAVESAIIDIENHPRRWPSFDGAFVVGFLDIFHTAFFYRISRREIIVVAIMHLHRHPRYWTKRR